MDEGLKVCINTWERQQPGYIFISQRNPWKDFNYKFPEDKKLIVKKFKELSEANNDIYWTPLTFSKNKRKEQYANNSNILYADLDFVKPDSCNIEPTVAWKSSNERYQSLWYLDEIMDVNELKTLNKSLTYAIGADKGGWDLTQVLRIPGTKNYKYEPVQEGRVLFNKNTIYNKFRFANLDKIDTASGPTGFIELLTRYKNQIGSKLSRMLQYPPDKITVGNRSDMLWKLESELVQKSIPMEDIVNLIQGSAWNKYKGRNDEHKRLLTEIQKVYDGKLHIQTDEPISEKLNKLPFISYNKLMASLDSHPGWLIEELWLRNSHGIVAGEPKTFKSTIALDMAISIASGVKLWDKYNILESGPVIIIQNENSEWIMKDRTEKMINSKNLIGSTVINGHKLIIKFPKELPIHFLNNFGYNFNDFNHREELEKEIQKIKPILVMFDPLYLMFDGDVNSAQELNPLLQWMLELKNKYKTSIMLIHHWNKNGSSSRGGQRMLGSTTLHGWTESALYLQEVDGNVVIEREFRAAGLKNKLELQIEMGDIGDPSYKVEFAEIENKSNDKMTAITDLLSLNPGGLSITQLSHELQISRDTIRKIVMTQKDIFENISTGNKSLVRLK